jgi:hypothetical protein
MVAGVLFPVSMFIYAWTAFPYVHWIAPTIGITVRIIFIPNTTTLTGDLKIFMTAAFTIYLAAFSYLADWWGRFSDHRFVGTEDHSLLATALLLHQHWLVNLLAVRSYMAALGPIDIYCRQSRRLCFPPLHATNVRCLRI